MTPDEEIFEMCRRLKFDLSPTMTKSDFVDEWERKTKMSRKSGTESKLSTFLNRTLDYFDLTPDEPIIAPREAYVSLSQEAKITRPTTNKIIDLQDKVEKSLSQDYKFITGYSYIRNEKIVIVQGYIRFIPKFKTEKIEADYYSERYNKQISYSYKKKTRINKPVFEG